MRVRWQYSLQKDFITALRRRPTRKFTIASTSTTWATLAPEPLRSASQGSLDPSWQRFEPKKRFHLLIELVDKPPNTQTYSFSTVPTKDPNGESSWLLCSYKAARYNCITIFIFVSITH